MNAPSMAHLTLWPVVESLAAKARSADTEAALHFSIVNDTFALLPYRAALLCTVRGRRGHLAHASGLTAVDRRTPYGSWVEAVTDYWLGSSPHKTRMSLTDVPATMQAAWQEYWPATVHMHPLRAHDGAVLAVVIYLSDNEWPPVADAMLAVLHQTQGAALEALRLRRSFWKRVWRRPDGRLSAGPWWLALAMAAMAAAMVVPIRQFVVAPAEIISLETMAVTAPVDGIIASVAVRPNQTVRRGDLLLRLDDTVIRNRLLAARQSLEVARAEYLATAHRSLVATDRVSEVAVLRGRINEKLAEVDYLQEQLRLFDIRASREGLAVYGQEIDLVGKPVSPGQKVMDIADPTRMGVQVWVPVADAINLKPGERFELMLYADPLTARTATIEQASYHALRSPEGVAAYRVRARLDVADASRLGLRGSAKMKGEEVSLGYFLFRRPIMVLRQRLGL